MNGTTEADKKPPESLEAKTQCITFFAGNTEYAVPILQVKEVVRLAENERITARSLSQEHVAGMINHRGKLVTIINLRGALSDSGSVINHNTNIVVVEIQIPDTSEYSKGEIREDAREKTAECFEGNSQQETPERRKAFLLGIAVESMPEIKKIPNPTDTETDRLTSEIKNGNGIILGLDVKKLAQRFLPQISNAEIQII